MKHQKGLSLIELMIAILISSLLMLGVLQLFSNTSASDRTSSAVARVQESGRIALEIIGADARRAGYQGCSSSANTTTVGSLTFPAAGVAAANKSVTFRYATTADTGTRFGTNLTCADDPVYLQTVTYSRCPSNGLERICRSVNGGNADPILDNANITAITFGYLGGGNLLWKESASVSTSDLEAAHAVRITLSITDQRNEITNEFTGTYELRNRLE
ncbi:hypothetical protein FQZ97_455260 [compost metagenome]